MRTESLEKEGQARIGFFTSHTPSPPSYLPSFPMVSRMLLLVALLVPLISALQSCFDLAPAGWSSDRMLVGDISTVPSMEECEMRCYALPSTTCAAISYAASLCALLGPETGRAPPCGSGGWITNAAPTAPLWIRKCDLPPTTTTTTTTPSTTTTAGCAPLKAGTMTIQRTPLQTQTLTCNNGVWMNGGAVMDTSLKIYCATGCVKLPVVSSITWYNTDAEVPTYDAANSTATCVSPRLVVINFWPPGWSCLLGIVHQFRECAHCRKQSCLGMHGPSRFELAICQLSSLNHAHNEENSNQNEDDEEGDRIDEGKGTKEDLDVRRNGVEGLDDVCNPSYLPSFPMVSRMLLLVALLVPLISALQSCFDLAPAGWSSDRMLVGDISTVPSMEECEMRCYALPSTTCAAISYAASLCALLGPETGRAPPCGSGGWITNAAPTAPLWIRKCDLPPTTTTTTTTPSTTTTAGCAPLKAGTMTIQRTPLQTQTLTCNNGVWMNGGAVMDTSLKIYCATGCVKLPVVSSITWYNTDAEVPTYDAANSTATCVSPRLVVINFWPPGWSCLLGIVHQFRECAHCRKQSCLGMHGPSRFELAICQLSSLNHAHNEENSNQNEDDEEGDRIDEGKGTKEDLDVRRNGVEGLDDVCNPSYLPSFPMVSRMLLLVALLVPLISALQSCFDLAPAGWSSDRMLVGDISTVPSMEECEMRCYALPSTTCAAISYAASLCALLGPETGRAPPCGSGGWITNAAPTAPLWIRKCDLPPTTTTTTTTPSTTTTAGCAPLKAGTMTIQRTPLQTQTLTCNNGVWMNGGAVMDTSLKIYCATGCVKLPVVSSITWYNTDAEVPTYDAANSTATCVGAACWGSYISFASVHIAGSNPASVCMGPADSSWQYVSCPP
ncbi:hypothetical protein PRIPAC_89997 [Pristionchus pacificus]|uniref:Uncharacterized protein n=1 Tax=Pristionchus pacificus TaxID=54126 RepID=A0A2A6CY84_PRIPA|nr:hypothetical protein PRIPAC_89997 [Pristionchus pacificus]|eukprot:PDM83098.1 hypothetical protein PRIPAC_37491 [Pristionchus pacificus]